MSDDEGSRRHRAIEMRTQRDNRFQPHTPLGPGVEFDSIRRMLERWGPHAKRIGDDGAVISPFGDRSLVASVDTSVEGVHFKREWMSPQEIGYRSAVAALSDLAAMGAKPLGMLVAMAIPEGWRSTLDAISDGIGEAAQLAQAPVLGGDMSRSSELALTITVLGTARDVLYRNAARPGNSVYVTGRLGGPGAALAAFSENRSPLEAYRNRFVRPVARIEESIWLAEHGAVGAIDISDGLSSDLCHIATASGVSIKIDLTLVPVMEGVSAEAAAVSGEEYELAAVCNTDVDTAEFSKAFGLELTKIGVIESGGPVVQFLLDGESVEIPGGYLHFE